MKRNLLLLLRLFIKLLRSSIFGILFFVLLIFTKYGTTFGLHRADFMCIAIVLVQGVLLCTKVESWSEVKVILVFHVLGFAMEVFKSHPSIGSRAYPDTGILTLLGVPLYSGFMYSAVGSFIFQAREQLDISFTDFPKISLITPIAVLIYFNFMTHHFVWDARYLLLIVSLVISWKTRIWFILNNKTYQMPAGLGLLLVGRCLWLAENIATYLGARVYPNQTQGRAMVDLHKIISWLLLFIVSLVIVVWYKRGELYPYTKNG